MTPTSIPLFPAASIQTTGKAFPVAETVPLYGPEFLSDAQIIEAMLNRVRPGRADQIRFLGSAQRLDAGGAG